MFFTIINILIEFFLLILIPFKKKKFKNIFFLIYAFIFATQITSLIEVGYYVPVIALTNLDNYKDVGMTPYYVFSGIFVFILLIAYFTRKYRKLLVSNIALILLIAFSLFYPYNSVHLFTKVWIDALKESIFLSQFKLNDQEKNEILKSITKDKIVYDSNVSDYIEPKKYNVILFFVESFSKNVVNKEVMPNVSKFLDESIDIQNYFNHTAATARGIRGQLFSFFQISGGSNKNATGVTQLTKDKIQEKFKQNNKLISLIDILNQNGYSSYFQSAQKNSSTFNIYLNTLGFKRLYGVEDKKNKDNYNPDRLSDQDSFALLQENLKNLKEPFFYTIYTFATHTKIDYSDHKYKDGSNPNLNKFYNFDYYFGEFLKWFKSSNLKDNTIIILTADHAHYPDKSFEDSFKNTSNAYIDKVVFGIYKNGITPVKFDANDLSSLSLAPTICDILDIKNGKNTFLGKSIFEKNFDEVNKISAIGPVEFYRLKNHKINKIDEKNDKKIIDKIINYEIIGG